MSRLTLKRLRSRRPPDSRVKHAAVTRLATLVGSGIPIGAALEAGGRAGGQAGPILAAMARSISRGRRLSHALASVAGCSAVEVALIEAGEASGRLDHALALLGERLGQRLAMRHRLARALFYPCMLVILTAAIVTAMGVFVIPTFASMYAGLGVELPIITRFIMAAANATTRHGFAAAMVGLLAAGSGYSIVRIRPKVRLRLHTALLDLPFVGRAVSASAKHDVYATLSALLEAGVELHQAIRLTAPAINNAAVRVRLRRVGELIERGWLPSAAVVRGGLDPHGEDAGLIRTAEVTGDYAACFSHLATVAGTEREERTQTLSRLLEPTAVLIMALAVCATVIGVYQPILGSATLLIGDMK